LPPCLDSLERRQQVDRLEIGDRMPGDRRKLLEQPLRFRDRGIGSAFGNHLLDVLARNLPEAIRRVVLGDKLFLAPHRTWIDALAQLPPGVIALPTRFRQSNFREGAEGDAFFLARKSVLQPPELRAVGSYLDAEAPLVGTLISPAGGLE